MQPVATAITAENIAGAGYKLAAVFFPIIQAGKDRGDPVEFRLEGLTTRIAKAMCLFQADPPEAPIETLFDQAQVSMTTLLGAVGGGHEGLFDKLRSAAEQGFPLSCVIDAPDQRLGTLWTTESTVHLVHQRRAGVPVMRLHEVVECPIQVSLGLGKADAEMPSLLPTLQSYVRLGYCVASIYNPPTWKRQGGANATNCYIVFEKTDSVYCVYVVDATFRCQAGLGTRTVDHEEYLGTIREHAAQGWELAALIDMPDQRLAGFGTTTSTVKLVFQAKTSAGAPGRDPIEVQVPDGSGAGATMQLTHPATGQTVQVVVPQGVGPGDKIKVRP